MKVVNEGIKESVEVSESELIESLWIQKKSYKKEISVYMPRKDFDTSKWSLLEITDGLNGYDGNGGWRTVTKMFKSIGNQFEFIIPSKEVTLTIPKSSRISVEDVKI